MVVGILHAVLQSGGSSGERRGLVSSGVQGFVEQLIGIGQCGPGTQRIHFGLIGCHAECFTACFDGRIETLAVDVGTLRCRHQVRGLIDFTADLGDKGSQSSGCSVNIAIGVFNGA